MNKLLYVLIILKLVVYYKNINIWIINFVVIRENIKMD